jgi:hypothetical protein
MNLVLIGMFNFLGQQLKSMQVGFVSYLYFFGQIVHLCKSNYVNLTNLRFLPKKSYVVAH